MTALFIWFVIKIPLLIVIAAIALYFVYLKQTHEIVQAECVACIKDNKNKNYRVTYRYYSWYDNIVEQCDKTLTAPLKRKTGKSYKLFVHKRISNIVKQFDKTIMTTTALVVVSIVIIIFL